MTRANATPATFGGGEATDDGLVKIYFLVGEKDFVVTVDAEKAEEIGGIIQELAETANICATEGPPWAPRKKKP